MAESSRGRQWMVYAFIIYACFQCEVEANTASTAAVSKSSPFDPPRTLSVNQVSTTVVPEVCGDRIDTCSLYGRTPCTNKVYEAWAKYHCALYCGFCTPNISSLNLNECQDKVPNCPDFDDGELCIEASYHSWAYEHCKAYCKFGSCNHTCADIAGVDCSVLDSTISICSNTEKAKTICRHHCGLCDMVNGKWSAWTSWGDCQATCGNGTQTRQRLCNNPPPHHGGLYCNGSNLQTQPCTTTPCPVHGDWSSWSAWNLCSLSCGDGLQRRDRQCNKPYPSLHGDHCFGTPIMYRTCNIQSCSVGQWSVWSAWSKCTDICGSTRYRERNCSSTRLSMLSYHCVGSYIETESCNCTTEAPKSNAMRLVGGSNGYSGRLEIFYNGQWGSVCDDGFSSSTAYSICKILHISSTGAHYENAARYVNNNRGASLPSPPSKIWLRYVKCSSHATHISQCSHSGYVGFCGHSEDVVMHCSPGTFPSFTATNPVSGVEQGTIAMSKLMLSGGSYYNTTTGTFTCPVQGIYSFTVTLTKLRAYGTHYAKCFIRVNGGNMVEVHINPQDNAYNPYGSSSASVSATFRLSAGTRVDLGSCSSAQYFDYSSSVFTGYLVKSFSL